MKWALRAMMLTAGTHSDVDELRTETTDSAGLPLPPPLEVPTENRAARRKQERNERRRRKQLRKEYGIGLIVGGLK